MKRFSIFLVLLMTASFVFSQRLPKKFAKQFEDTGLFYFKYHHKGLNAKPDILNYSPDKMSLGLSCISEEEYLKEERPYLDSSLFSDTKKASVKDIKSVMRRGLRISDRPSYSTDYEKRRWVDGKKLSFEICYNQSTKKNIPIFASGVYTFTVFSKDGVYRMSIADFTDCTERNADYDALTDYLYFNEGIKRDMSRGIEGTRGYYFIDEDAADSFYQKLIEKDASLPESALRFQEAAECIETILKNYK